MWIRRILHDSRAFWVQSKVCCYFCNNICHVLCYILWWVNPIYVYDYRSHKWCPLNTVIDNLLFIDVQSQGTNNRRHEQHLLNSLTECYENNKFNFRCKLYIMSEGWNKVDTSSLIKSPILPNISVRVKTLSGWVGFQLLKLCISLPSSFCLPSSFIEDWNQALFSIPKQRSDGVFGPQSRCLSFLTSFTFYVDSLGVSRKIPLSCHATSGWFR